MRVSGVVLALSFLAVAFAINVCDEDNGYIIGDPHFTGFYGQTFDFMGTPGNFYNLLSDPYMSLNARFELTNPSRPSRRTTILYEIGLIFGEHKVSFENADEVWIDGAKVKRQLGTAHTIEISECLTLYWTRNNVINFQGPHHEMEFSLSHNNNINVNTTFWNVAFLHPLEDPTHTGGVLGQTANPSAQISTEEKDFVCSSIFDTSSQTNKFRGKVANCNNDVNKRYAGVERSSEMCGAGEFCLFDGESFDCISEECDANECGFDNYCGEDGNCYMADYVIDQLADEAVAAYSFYSQVDGDNMGYAVEDDITFASSTMISQIDAQFLLVDGAQWSDVTGIDVNVYSNYMDIFEEGEVEYGDVMSFSFGLEDAFHVPEFVTNQGTVHRLRLPVMDTFPAGTYFVSIIIRTEKEEGFILYQQENNSGNLYYYDESNTPKVDGKNVAAALRFVIAPTSGN